MMEHVVGIATLVKVGAPDARGIASVYRLDPPLNGNEYVVVSSIDRPREGMEEMMEMLTVLAEMFGSIPPVIDGGNPSEETFIFACDNEGNVSERQQLPGSVRGTMDHIRALQQAGYELQMPALVEIFDQEEK